MLRGIFARGATNINTMESQYRLNPALVAFGIVLALLFQITLLVIIYFGLNATLSTTLIIFILMSIGDLCLIAVASYMSRLYLREEMIDMAMLFANYNPNILREGSTLINSSYDALKIAKSDMREELELKLEVSQLRSEVDALSNKDSSNDFMPLIQD